MSRRTLIEIGSLGLLLAAGLGCLKRKETITIAPDGGAVIAIEYRGSEQDLGGRDALPSSAGGWAVTRTTETTKRPDGSEEREEVLSGERRCAAGQPLPSSFAVPGDVNAELYAQFPTTLTIEQRADGAYYHLRRVYQPRRWAYVEYWNKVFVDDDIKKLVEQPSESLTTAERATTFKAFAGYESRRQLEFAKAALVAGEPGLPPDVWLRARAALLSVYEAVRYEELAARYEGMSKEQADADLEQEAERILASARAAVIESLRREPGLTDARIAALTAGYDRQKLAYDITSETGGHSFEIRVKLPGEIVAHNADRIDEHDDGALVWEFNGEAFRDRTHELQATSRVAK